MSQSAKRQTSGFYRKAKTDVIDDVAVGGAMYVGNLNTAITKQQLHEFFSKKGIVMRIDLPLSGSVNRGYAVVEFSSDEVAATVIQTLNDELFQGRPLKLRAAPKGLSG